MQNRLRIGFVCIQDANDITAWSGTPSHMLESLRRLDVDVEVYSPLSQRIKYLLAPIKWVARINRSRVTLDHYPLVLNSYASQIARAMREHPVDVIVSNSSIPVTALDCTQPIIFWTDAVFHGMYEYYKGAFTGLTPAGIERGKRQEEAALNRCSYAVYSSDWAANSARQLTDPDKVKVVPFGASLEVRHTRSDVLQWARARRQSRPSQCKLLFIGVDWERKGGAVAVETAKILNELGTPTTLTIVGCQPPVPVPEYVHVLGFISKSTSEGQQQLQTLLREADFFILPTLAEASAIVFCEANAFGLPLLSYATGGVSDYIRTGVNGACLPVGTAGAGFAESIQTMLKDVDNYEALCLGAYDEYASRLNWESSARAIVKFSHHAVASRTSSMKASQPKR